MTTHNSSLPEVQIALGDGEPLTDSQTRLLDILLDPQNFDDAEQSAESRPLDWILNSYAQFNRSRRNRLSEVQEIAGVLHEHYDRVERAHNSASRGTPFTFSWGSDYSTDITGYEVSVRLSHLDAYLLEYHDIKRLSHDSTGLRYALDVAEHIHVDYRRLLGKAIAYHLLPPIDSEITDEELEQIWKHTG